MIDQLQGSGAKIADTEEELGSLNTRDKTEKRNSKKRAFGKASRTSGLNQNTKKISKTLIFSILEAELAPEEVSEKLPAMQWIGRNGEKKQENMLRYIVLLFVKKSEKKKSNYSTKNCFVMIP